MRRRDIAVDPGPKAEDMLRGWGIVRTGRVRPGDKYWQFGTRKWLVDRRTFLGENAATPYCIFIRRLPKESKGVEQ